MTPVFVTQLGFAACFHFFSLSSLVCSRFAAAIPIIRCATVLAAAASNTWHFLVSHCSVTLQHSVTQCHTPTLSCQTITKPVLPPPSPSPSHYYFCHQNIRFAAKWWKSDFASTDQPLKIPKRWSPVLTGSLIAIRLNNPHKARIWGETRCGNVLMGKSNRGNRKSSRTTTLDAISPTRGSDSPAHSPKLLIVFL